MLWRLPLCGLAAAVILSNISFAQANVNESLETAFIYVNGTTGSDSNSGTKSSPLKTIGAAASMAENNNYSNIGSRVYIEPGTYREYIDLRSSARDTSMPITFQATSPGTVIVSGSTLYTGWATYDSNPSIYTNSWLNTWGECSQMTICPYQQNIMMRQEMVVVNGLPLTQVMSLTQMQVGTFYVDEAGAMIYVWPPAHTNMTTATVDVASLPTLLSIVSKSNVVIRGLTFQYASSCRARGAVEVWGNATNILFDTDTFQWNNAEGLSISGDTNYYTVKKSIALHNGDSGFEDQQNLYGWWQSDTTSYNNWRGAQGAYYACNTAGYHASLTHNDTIKGLTMSFNETWGVHWDTDNANITASAVNATANYLSGAFLEKDEGPISISKSYFCNQTQSGTAGGLTLRNSEQVSLTSSVIMNNVPAELQVIGQAGGIEVTNWQTGVTTNLVTQNFTNTWNVIQGNTSSTSVFNDAALGGTDWTSFQSTLVSSNNTWWNAYNSTTPFVVPTPKNNSKDDFSQWQGLTLTDSSSRFAAPSGNVGAACNLTPVGPDYWLTINNALLTVSPGGSVTYNLAVTPLSFSGIVTLTLDGVSEVPGLSATLSPTSINTSGTSVLTVTAGLTTAPGTYSITVMANNGNITRTVTVQLTVL